MIASTKLANICLVLSMNNTDVQQELARCKRELDHVQTTINTFGVTSPVTPYLTKYALIRACGAIEVAFKALVADYCSYRSKKQVKRYIHMRIRRGSANPSQKNITSMLRDFDDDWKKNFKARLNADPDRGALLDSLQSLVDARNEFAHGGSPPVSIGDVLKHFENAKRVVEHVDLVVV